MRPGQSKIPDPDREKDLFISLAERAAVNLGQPVGKALYAWLDHLRENSSNFREADGPHEIHWDGVCVEKYTWGVMERPCQASADCCFKLQTHAIAAGLRIEAPGQAVANPVQVGAPAPPAIGGQASLSFWESLRRGFMQLRDECAINPPLNPAGQLSAIWESQPEPGRWRLNYRSGNDGLGVAKRFQWHAQSASARLGFTGEGDAAVAHWLDQIKGDAPRAHVRRLVGGGSLESVELLDICGLSADYCRKCGGDETRLALNAPNHPTTQNVRRSETSIPDLVHGGDGSPGLPTTEASADAGGEAGRDGYSPDQPIHLSAPSFVYQYPPDFPDAEQLFIEDARLEANRELENREVLSFDDYSAVHLAWFWHVVSAAATAIGRAGASLHWGANRRREMLLDFGLRAAQAADIAGRDGHRFRRLCESPEWRAFDELLLRPTAYAEAVATVEQRVVQTVRRKARGRPTEISDELKEKALQIKGGKERAKILYQTRYPTVQQVKNVPTILRHFSRKRQPKAE
jgi:hypothetical protein